MNELREAELSYDPAQVMQMLRDADDYNSPWGFDGRLSEEDVEDLEATWTWEPFGR